ncbi:MAG: hypothetical protein WBA68_05360 [Alteraurantiacibacter sp.]
MVDQLAAEIAREISSQTDSATREYSSVIWTDGNGAVHRTEIAPGEATNATGIGDNFAQVDFVGGGKIVAILHNHSTFVESMVQGEEGLLVYNSDGHLPSSVDMNTLITVSNGTIPGREAYDPNNYRNYLLFNGRVSEFYAADQDESLLRLGGQADWAVKSSD